MLERKRKDVGLANGLSRVPGEQLDAFAAHDVFSVGHGAVDAFGTDIGQFVAQGVDELAAQVRHADGVGVGEGDGHAGSGAMPVTIAHELVPLAPDVLGGLADERQEVAADALSERSCGGFRGHGSLVTSVTSAEDTQAVSANHTEFGLACPQRKKRADSQPRGPTVRQACRPWP